MAARKVELIRLRQVEFQYPGGAVPSLTGIDLSVRAGELVLVTGPTGCGKSTLLKVISGIIPLESSGRFSGSVMVDSLETRQSSLPELARKVGLVFQSPNDQLCASTVMDEVAFGPQNLGLGQDEVNRRLQWALEQVGLSGHRNAQTARLSGGQKQRVVIAAQLAMGQAVLALDEPLSQLDPQGAAEVLDCLMSLRQKGLAIILVEHRLGECMELASRLVVLDQGRVLLDRPTREMGEYLDLLEKLGLKIPDGFLARKCLAVDSEDQLQKKLSCLRPPADHKREFGQVVLALQNVSHTYPEAPQSALQDCSLEILQGETLAVIGPNGAGKSTLLGIMAGLHRPRTGSLLWRGKFMKKYPPVGKVGFLMQNPDLLLLETSLGQELMSGPRFLRMPDAARRSRALAAEIGLKDSWDVPPWTLSKGQRLRAALGAILSTRPELLLLDEPTAGQNQANIHRLLTTLGRQKHLHAIVLCSHDLETVARFADRVAVLKAGSLIDLGTTRQVLSRLKGDQAESLKPHWPLCTSLELGIDPPFLTLDEMLAAAGKEVPACARTS